MFLIVLSAVWNWGWFAAVSLIQYQTNAQGDKVNFDSNLVLFKLSLAVYSSANNL
jgi:hypothetical protein